MKFQVISFWLKIKFWLVYLVSEFSFFFVQNAIKSLLKFDLISYAVLKTFYLSL